MTPVSAPLPALPTTPNGTPIFLPILGHKTEPVTRFLRSITGDSQPQKTITVASQLTSIFKGTATTIHNRLWLAMFRNHHAVFAALEGTLLRFYPQPLFAPLGSATQALLEHNPTLVQNLATAARLSPPVAHSAETALLGGHLWPTWTTLDLSCAQTSKAMRPSDKKIQEMVFNLLHAQYPPKCPPNWYSLNHVPIAVHGRMLTLNGTTAPTAHIPEKQITTHNTAWAQRLCKGIETLFSDPNLFPPWTLVRQTIRDTQTAPLEAGVVWQKTIPLQHNRMSAHERMQCARALPPHVLDVIAA